MRVFYFVFEDLVLNSRSGWTEKEIKYMCFCKFARNVFIYVLE